MNRLGGQASLETRHERTRGIAWGQARNNKINRNRGPESHQIEAGTAEQVLHLDTPSSWAYASSNECRLCLGLSFLRAACPSTRVTLCCSEDGCSGGGSATLDDAPTPDRGGIKQQV